MNSSSSTFADRRYLGASAPDPPGPWDRSAPLFQAAASPCRTSGSVGPSAPVRRIAAKPGRLSAARLHPWHAMQHGKSQPRGLRLLAHSVLCMVRLRSCFFNFSCSFLRGHFPYPEELNGGKDCARTLSRTFGKNTSARRYRTFPVIKPTQCANKALYPVTYG